MDAIIRTPAPSNEHARDYAPGSPHRASLADALADLAKCEVELTNTIDGVQQMASGAPFYVRQPHRHSEILGVSALASHDDARKAVAAALRAAPGWRAMPFSERAAILLRAADLLSGPWRDTLNAATMLGQSKTVVQAEIDAACELADFWRFNVHFARQIHGQQPHSAPGAWNRLDYRPLEGFVYAITPFNFTAIAANLPTAPALMGNTVIWKPAPTQSLAAHFTMRLLEQAGLPPGVINLVTGDGVAVSEVALADPDLAGIHFTGSTLTFQHLWSSVGANIGRYRSYPRVVGETGGKDFVLAHTSADVDVLRTALVRGAFDYQGQKCSAASRAFIPRSVWSRLKDDLVSEVRSLPMGDVTDFRNFLGAVIDHRAFNRLDNVLSSVRSAPDVEVLTGGTADGSEGYFVAPTVLLSDAPEHEIFRTEFFGPILAVHVYEDREYDLVLNQVDKGTAYGLTGSLIASDRTAITHASERLRFAAGNFYINDKPTGAVVGQQPFGGGRASGTNDKAGSIYNLLRWVSPRTIKENFLPPVQSAYPHQS